MINITQVTISPNPVNANSSYKITVKVDGGYSLFKFPLILQKIGVVFKKK